MLELDAQQIATNTCVTTDLPILGVDECGNPGPPRHIDAHHLPPGRGHGCASSVPSRRPR